MDEIWGCRHIVEANHGNIIRSIDYFSFSSLHNVYFLSFFSSGLHPDGLPCQKKTQPLFDNITRDVSALSHVNHVISSLYYRCVYALIIFI